MRSHLWRNSGLFTLGIIFRLAFREKESATDQAGMVLPDQAGVDTCQTVFDFSDNSCVLSGNTCGASAFFQMSGLIYDITDVRFSISRLKHIQIGCITRYGANHFQSFPGRIGYVVLYQLIAVAIHIEFFVHSFNIASAVFGLQQAGNIQFGKVAHILCICPKEIFISLKTVGQIYHQVI
ncbi:MAG: hypothetical protein GY845_37195 [Planctomycetes bacterium]|nr:hypothetical protein [Planctomycetota bacterium]